MKQHLLCYKKLISNILQNVKDGSIEGCAINLLKVTTKKEYAQPKNPVSGLNLTKKLEPLPQGPGKFNLGLYPVPRSSQLNTALPLTAFLIRVERDLQSYYYIKACYFKHFYTNILFKFDFFPLRTRLQAEY